MVYFCKKDETGEIISIGSVSGVESIPAGCEECSEAQRDAWVTEREAQLAASAEDPKPSAVEQMRADLDYLAALQGVTL